MKRSLLRQCCVLLFVIAYSNTATAQQPVEADSAHYKIVSAGPEYKKSAFYQWLWGRNYRKEWIAQVRLPIIQFDTLRGGVISFKEGGSNQSQSLQLKTLGDKEYALRSVDKSLDKVIPKIFHKTFVAKLVNDEISMSNPYGALGVPVLAEAVGVKHTVPAYFYLPAQEKLDTLNKKYAGKVYLFEQRPKGNWGEADNLGNFLDFKDFEDMLPAILKDHNSMVDQQAFARARLLDMLIGDFDRHADQWKWGVKQEGSKTIFVPVPTDRDQAFSTHNGVLLDLVLRLAKLKFMQKYDYEIRNVKAFATINRLLDRWVTNKMTLPEWQAIATDMQGKLTDSILEQSIKQMPPEIISIRADELIAKLKSRRDHLLEYATDYYGLLAEEAEVIGTEGNDYVEINQLHKDSIEIKLYNIGSNREKEAAPFYSRIFLEKETDEIRIYGLDGQDIYKISGQMSRAIDLRIIGGKGRDSIIDEAISNGSKRVHVYDNKDNSFTKAGHLNLHLSEDSAVHVYNYNSFLPDKKGFIPHLIYNDADRIFVGIRYYVLNNKWRKKPFAYKQSLDVDYSISQKGFSTTYTGLFPKLLGKWDLLGKINYDWVRWTNFHGLGNETPNVTRNRDYYRMRSEDGSASLGLQRIADKNRIGISGFYHRVKIINDTARFVSKSLSTSTPDLFSPDDYAGAQFNYDFASVKDSVLPQRGISFSLNARHTENMNDHSRSFQTYSGRLQFFIPIVPKLSLAIKTGAATVAGKPMFYQYPTIGESYDLRAFRRERFSGKSTFFNNTELRFISDVRSYLFNGKAGLLAFIDNGRVWMPGEKSDKIHTSYGGGILLAPFNLMSAAITYGISDELKMLQIRVGTLF